MPSPACRARSIGVASWLTLIACADARFFTGPHGPGGSWNLYEVVTVPASWTAADAAARAREAQATGVAGASGLTLTGHLVEISSEDENTFVAAAATVTPGAGNSNLWLGLNDREPPNGPGERGTIRTGWRWSGAGADLDAGEFHAWSPGEPNNAGNEDAAEMRGDGAWNDSAVSATRRYVIEWDTAAAAPVAGAAQYPVYYTAPFGPGGTWNLYRIVMSPASWETAHAAATGMTAGATGVSGAQSPLLANLPGHLLAPASEAENTFAWRAMAFGGMNDGGGAGTGAYWTGGTDDPRFGGAEAGTNPAGGWAWAGGGGAYGWNRFSRYPQTAAAKPDNIGGSENFIETDGAGFWNDLSGDTRRRYVMEWETNAPEPVAGAARLAPLVAEPLPAFPANADGWTVKTWRAPEQANVLTNLPAALAFVQSPAASAVVSEAVMPALNVNDLSSGAGDPGRSLSGLFWPDVPLPGDTPDTNDDFVLIRAATKRALAAGVPYTVNVHSDDGFLLRVTGPEGAVAGFTGAGGLGFVDPADAATLFLPYGTGDSNTRGFLTVSETGEYTFDFIGWEGTGGSFFEVSLAENTAAESDWDTEWTLLGGPSETAPALPLPAGTLNAPDPVGDGWGARAVSGAGTLGTFASAVAALQGAAGNAVTAQLPVLNYSDPKNPGDSFRFSADTPPPGDTPADDDNFAVAAKGTLHVPAAGLYTIAVHADDGFALRVVGAQWRGRVTGHATGFIDSADASVMHWPFLSADSDTRAVIRFPAAGAYALELAHHEAAGASSLEVSWAPGVVAREEDGLEWRLIGDNAALTPLLPRSPARSRAGEAGLWGLHVARKSGAAVDSLTNAVSVIEDAAGQHFYGLSPVLNHIDPQSPGVSGVFAGDLTLPGDTAANDDNFAVHARGRLVIPAAGYYTFAVRSGDGWALRITGARWRGRRVAGIDPADPATLALTRTGSPTGITDWRGAGSVWLEQGSYDADFLTYENQRESWFEVYAAAGDRLDSSEQIPGALLGSATPDRAWKLLGHRAAADGLAAVPVMKTQWLGRVSTPVSSAPPAWFTVPGALDWLEEPAAAPRTFSAPALNFLDPGFGPAGTIPNDAPFPGNTAADDQYFAMSAEGVIVIPRAGFYSFGWQADDGGCFEFLRPPASVSFMRLSANAVGSSFIASSSDGTLGGRIQCNGAGANTRTTGDILLPAGEYPVRSVWYEGSGSAHVEVFGAAAGQPYGLLASGGAGLVPDLPGLALASQELRVLSAVLSAAREFIFTWNSVPGVTYAVERSVDLLTWIPAAAGIPSGGQSTGWTSPVLPVGDTRIFFRARCED